MQGVAGVSPEPPALVQCGTWHESAGCCSYPAAPTPAQRGIVIHVKTVAIAVQSYTSSLNAIKNKQPILTLSLRQARAAAILSAVTLLVAEAVNLISSGQCKVNSHCFSFPPFVLNCMSSCREKFSITYSLLVFLLVSFSSSNPFPVQIIFQISMADLH